MNARDRGGRPATFDRETALRQAVVVFWERGYEATSLPELLAAMDIARSSFYASFGSKHRVMLEALDLYTMEQYEDLRMAAASASTPMLAIEAVMKLAACTKRPAHGCLFLNTVSELASRDAEVNVRSRAHLSRIDKLLRELLSQLGHAKDVAVTKSAALMSLAAGAVLLRKAGESERRISGLLKQVTALAG